MRVFDKHTFTQLTNMEHTHHHLLRTLGTQWGHSSKLPHPILVKRYPLNYQHPLTICTRTDPVTTNINQSDAEFLLLIFQMYGPMIVHPERVTTALPLMSTNNLAWCVKLHVDYATRADTPMRLEDVYMKVRTSVAETCTYYPEWNHPTHMVPFLTPTDFQQAFEKMTCGCLDGLPWQGVVAAGEAVAMCLTKGRYTSQANQSYDTAIVDLYTLTPSALLETIAFFDKKYKGRIFWGLGKNTTPIVCITGVPRVFRIMCERPHTNQQDIVNHLDIDFIQVCYSDGHVLMSPTCVRSHATRVCVVSPYVLPNRQSMALDHGLGLKIYGVNSLPTRTFWDHPKTYTPKKHHTPEQTRYNMHLNLGCWHVANESRGIAEAVMNTPPTDLWYTGNAFLTCDNTTQAMYDSLTHTLPVEGVVGYVLPFQVVFQKSLWLFLPQMNSVMIKDDANKYIAPGRHELVAFTKRIQLIINVLYGEDACHCPVETTNTLHIEYMPNCRLVDTHTHTLVTPEELQKTKQNYAICTEMHCSTILMGPTWWSPVFTCVEIEVFPLDLIHNTK